MSVVVSNVKYTFLIPLFNEEENIKMFHNALISSIKKNGINECEIIYVNDGSTDDSLDVLKVLEDVKIINFQRNFGKSCALQAGFEESQGEYVFTMDADMQDDPEEIPKFIDKIKDGFDVISGWKKNRLDPWHKVYPSKLANFVTRKLSGVKIHDMNCGFKLYKKKVVKNLYIYGNIHRYIPTLCNHLGYKVGEVAVNHRPRKYGVSKYGFDRFLKSFFDLITVMFLTKYIQYPLYYFGKIAFFCFLLSGAGLIYLFVVWMSGESIGTRPLFTVSVLLAIVGFQFISIGLICDMINNTNKKQKYIIDEIICKK